MNSQEGENVKTVRKINGKKQKMGLDIDKINNFQNKIRSYGGKSTISANLKGPNGLKFQIAGNILCCYKNKMT